eukprot:Skav221930  [mRNA]  locus=scaffold195:280438:282709:+ [translate_table: standard]
MEKDGSLQMDVAGGVPSQVEQRSAQHRRALIMRRAVRRRQAPKARWLGYRDASMLDLLQGPSPKPSRRAAKSVMVDPHYLGRWPEISVVDTSIGPDMSQDAGVQSQEELRPRVLQSAGLAALVALPQQSVPGVQGCRWNPVVNAADVNFCVQL